MPEQITLKTADDKHRVPKYYTRVIQGCLDDFAEPVHAIMSKKYPGTNSPSTSPVQKDLTLSVEQALRHYQKRWCVEVDNTYLKNVLGLGDFKQ